MVHSKSHDRDRYSRFRFHLEPTQNMKQMRCPAPFPVLNVSDVALIFLQLFKLLVVASFVSMRLRSETLIFLRLHS